LATRGYAGNLVTEQGKGGGAISGKYYETTTGLNMVNGSELEGMPAKSFASGR